MSKASASCDRPKRDATYAEKLTKHCKKGITDVGHPDIFMVPLVKTSYSLKGSISSNSFGQKPRLYQPRKVIMVVGATGTGKSTLINTMINYILGVKWEDNFRFKLVDEHGTGVQSQAHSQTQITSSYTIYSNKHHTIPFTLTIIDTPGFGDTRGIERDKAIVEQIREFFSHPGKHGVDRIDAVGFVVQASQARLTHTQRYIFDSTLSLFGKDIKPNIILLITFCTGRTPVVLDAIKEADIPYSGRIFKFDNEALFARNKENEAESDSDEEEVHLLKPYWQRGMKETEKMFLAIADLDPKSLTLSQETLETRKELEATITKLRSQIRIYSDKMEHMKKEQQILENCKKEIEDNKNFHFETDVMIDEKIDTDVGSMNCDFCQYTCHYPCRRPDDEQKKLCHMMGRNGHCMVCPKKCIWSNHTIQKYRHCYTTQKQSQSYAEIEMRYKDATGKKPTIEEVIKELKKDIEKHEQIVAGMILKIHECVQRLEDIALKPQPMGLREYIDVLIKTEEDDAEYGWQDRVARLKEYKTREELFDQVKQDKGIIDFVSDKWGDLKNYVKRKAGYTVQ